MELRWLPAFLAVADELNFSRAADRLHIAQPAFSNQIKQLETGLAVRLFERNNRSVRLSAAGEAFRVPCEKALRYAAEAETAAREADWARRAGPDRVRSPAASPARSSPC